MTSNPDDFWTSSRALSFLRLFLMAQARSCSAAGNCLGAQKYCK
ncbi:hypothetical protein CFter6_5075 [Collimonas fungivorans]|jgi:hypothetical protein|uniref:Uncharacterized protein n=1 Tax=Collimonas fungivorans TaxID=158899 RepID=A0A127PIV6_9BURK|nr:hypothetical protein CFter6_5075 [Collimonas fungivorans]